MFEYNRFATKPFLCVI